MTEKWKDLFITITLGFICILAFITIVDVFLLKMDKLNIDPSYTVFASIIGGMISGGITFLGVRLTLKNDRKIIIANYSKEEVYKYIEALNKLELVINSTEESVKFYDRLMHYIEEIEEYETSTEEVKEYYKDYQNLRIVLDDYFKNCKSKYQLDIDNYELLTITENNIAEEFHIIEKIYNNHELGNLFGFDKKDFSYTDAKYKVNNIKSFLETYRDNLNTKLSFYREQYNENKLI